MAAVFYSAVVVPSMKQNYLIHCLQCFIFNLFQDGRLSAINSSKERDRENP